MKHYSLVVTRISPSENVLVVPFETELDFAVKRSFIDVEFVALMQRLGINSDEAELRLAMTYRAPIGFAMSLELSSEQTTCLHSYFPCLDKSVCLTA